MIVLMLAFLFFQFGSQKMSDLVHFGSRSSAASRIMIWSAAGRIIRDNWLFGIGPNRFQDKYLEYQKYFPPYLEWSVPEPHNLLAAFWLQSGLLGLAGFMSLLWIWLKRIVKKEKTKIVVAAAAIIIYILAHGLVDTTYFKQDLASIFWLAFLAAI